jgi:NDP-sugar pyrophosphorylase family protein
METITGIGLAAGRGERFRPLTLKAKGFLRAKAAVLLLGRRVMDWILGILQAQGLQDFVILTKGKENRYQIKAIVGYGESVGARIRYSPVSLDRENAGSADALLANLDYFNIGGTVFVFPTDSVLDIDLAAMVAQHRRTGAAVTIASAAQPAEFVAGQYGWIDHGPDGRVAGFVEKPSLAAIRARLGEGPLPILSTNAGFYLMEAAVLRAISAHPEVEALRARAFDIGGDLLPWLVRHGYPVYAHQIGRMGDLGNIASYLDTMGHMLFGRFHSITPLMPPAVPGRPGVMIDPETLALTDLQSGLTLAEKMAQGLVDLRPPLRIGKYVRIFPGVTLEACNIDDDCELSAGATIRRASIGPGSLIGPGCLIEDALLGFMVEALSTPEQPVVLQGGVAIGDEVILQAGVALRDGVLIHPRLKVPRGITLPPRAEVESLEQILEALW